jgi:hypothetical protein
MAAAELARLAKNPRNFISIPQIMWRRAISRSRKRRPAPRFLQEVNMTPTAVLAIGLDPRFADIETTPQFTPELIRAYIEAEIARVRELGFDAETCLIAPGEMAEAEIEATLQDGDFDRSAFRASAFWPGAVVD